MRFCWSTLHVRNMEESVQFYQSIVGLTVNRRFNAGPGMEIAFLGDGDTLIELIGDQNVKEIHVGEDISWGFEVKSVKEMIETLKAKNINLHSGPFAPNPHVEFFYILDPNGLKIQFVENK